MQVKKEIFEVDMNGYIVEKYVAEFDKEGNCLEELSENIITMQPENGLYRAKWTGSEWIEDMTQEEINELNNQPKLPTTDDFLLDFEFRLSVLELGL